YRAPSTDLSAFGNPVRWLGGALAVAAVVLVTFAGLTQIKGADALVGQPHLGLQAGGVRRFQYTPRLLDVVRRIPRGSIVDRNGLALATEDPDLRRQARPRYARLRLAVDDA